MSVSAPLAAIRAQHPLLHCISNIVSANDCANLALAIGASPHMAQAPPAMADIAALASAVVLNTGTPDEAKFTAARTAAAYAARERRSRYFRRKDGSRRREADVLRHHRRKNRPEQRFGMDAVPGGCFAGDHQKRRYYHQTCDIHALCAGVGGAEKRPVALCELPPVHCAEREKNHRQRAHDVC